MLPQINENLTVNELTRLNDTLRKNADMVKANVGYQSAAGTFGGDAQGLAPIVPQSIESVLASATFTMQDLVLWQKLPKVQVSNTLHEYAVINEHGQDLDPFIEEGGGGSADFGSSNAVYERKSVKIKYMAERRQVSDVANLVGIIGANPNALAEETERGTMSLMRKVENQLFWGDEAANARGFDGILKQIERPSADQNDLRSGDLSSNTFDMGGTISTNTALPELFNDVLGELHSAPRFGRPDVVMVEPRIYSQLVKASIQGGRNDQLLISGKQDGVLTFGAGPQLHIMGPMGPVPVMSAPFLHRQFKAPAAGSSEAPALGAAAALAQVADGVDLEGEFAAGKFYKYKVVGVTPKGYSAPVLVESAANEGVEVGAAGLQVSLAASVDMVGGYYRIYRSESAAAAADVDADSCVLLYEVPAAADGSIDFIDRGMERHGTGRAMFMQMDSNVVEFARLLDFLRRPLAETSAAKQFLLMLFGSPIVKVPQKCFTVRGIPYSQVF